MYSRLNRPGLIDGSVVGNQRINDLVSHLILLKTVVIDPSRVVGTRLEVGYGEASQGLGHFCMFLNTDMAGVSTRVGIPVGAFYSVWRAENPVVLDACEELVFGSLASRHSLGGVLHIGIRIMFKA